MSGAKELLNAIEGAQRIPPLGEGRGATPDEELAARIALALEQIEAAQRLLGAAAANLSPIIGAASIWEATGKLYDRVHNHWRRLAYNTHRGWRLDGMALERHARKPEGAR